jgi:catechol 2,3-dioxygenase-like lactoylglutathione lyase family enzyme
MAVELNHIIVWCRDKAEAANFFATILDRPAPKPFLHFLLVELDNRVSLDFMEKRGPVALQHYAFLVSESEFDAAFARIIGGGLEHWADPARSQPQRINQRDGGRGVYFNDPNGHLLELLTRPYGML